MKFDFKGEIKKNSPIKNFVSFLLKLKINSLFEYKGLIVEIDPTIDYNDNNVLIRWTDTNEGFNDKIIYTSLKNFKKDFKLIE